MKLVVVESPTKCKTIQYYLGKGYEVFACKGSVRDLANKGPRGLGIDIDNNFKPTYEVKSTSNAVVNELKKKYKESSELILATDPDREGEAIAWHITQILSVDPKTTKRLEFHEITRDSIENAINNPRTIDFNLVDSQETRRIIDKIIGFDISHLLQRKANLKSAGRVQSPTLRLICDHEEEIRNFVPEDFYEFGVDVKIDNQIVKLALSKVGAKKFNPLNLKDLSVVELYSELVKKGLKITSITSKDVSTPSSYLPFTTSSMQQAAITTYKFNASLVTSLAQTLYEGVQIEGKPTSLITYIRTDSTALSDTYVNDARYFIEKTYGKSYFHGKKTAKAGYLSQNAHEAIRPTNNELTPQRVRADLLKNRHGEDLYKLYKLIYNNALASLMSPKKEHVSTIVFEAGNLEFKYEVRDMIFDGYTKVLGDKSQSHPNISNLKVGDVLEVEEIHKDAKQTEAPARYTEARIIKLMEEKGIGRPSTYASTINILYNHKYLSRKEGKVIPTDEGVKNTNIMKKYFKDIVDTEYTARLEVNLDKIQEGEETKLDFLKEFYKGFSEQLDTAKQIMYRDPDEKIGRKCPVCGHDLVLKKTVNGDFIGCSNYPKCSYIEKEKPEEVGENCPECGAPLVYRYTKANKKFISCSNYPKCTYSRNITRNTKVLYKQSKCPTCGGNLYIKKGPYGRYLECENFTQCNYRKPLKKTYRKKA